jgi:hypothetical protein
MEILPLPDTGWLATCGVAEGRDGLLEPATLVEATECCVDTCNQAQKECRDHCLSDLECDDCRIESRVCVEACLNPVANSRYKDYYGLCARGYGCLTPLGVDGDCATTHSKAILECCRHACIPMGNVGCEGCKYAEQIALRGKADHKKTYKKKTRQKAKPTPSSAPSTDQAAPSPGSSCGKWWLAGLGMLLALVIIIAAILLTRN